MHRIRLSAAALCAGLLGLAVVTPTANASTSGIFRNAQVVYDTASTASYTVSSTYEDNHGAFVKGSIYCYYDTAAEGTTSTWRVKISKTESRTVYVTGCPGKLGTSWK